MNERDLATIEKITKLAPIEGADKIEVASILGWEVIVQKGEFKEGDLVVYCEYDTILPPKPEFEFLRSRCYSKAYDGFRIRNMKLRGVYSQGIVFPLRILPEDCTIKEGKVVAEILGIRRYDPMELREKTINVQTKKYTKFQKFLLRFSWYRRWVLKKTDNSYPEYLSKSGETNIQKMFNELSTYKGTQFYITEKLEGQAATYALYKGKFDRYSHNVKLKPNSPGSWCKVEEMYGIEKVLREIKNRFKGDYAIQGEIIGPGIQHNIYELPTYEFYVYRVKNLTKGIYLEYHQLLHFIKEFNFIGKAFGFPELKMVPVLEFQIGVLDSVQEMIIHSEREKSVLNPKVMREGVVWRSVNDQRVGFKVKSPKYALWFEKKEETEHEI